VGVGSHMPFRTYFCDFSIFVNFFYFCIVAISFGNVFAFLSWFFLSLMAWLLPCM